MKQITWIVFGWLTLLPTAQAELPLHVKPADTVSNEDVCFSLLAHLDLVGEKNRKRVCKSEIALLLKKPIVPINVGDKMKLGDKEITSCEQYLENPYGAFSTGRRELAIEAPFMRTCGVLASLWNAQQSKNYFSTLKKALHPMHLPPTLIDISATSDQAEEILSLENEGKTAQDIIKVKDVIQKQNGLSYHDLSLEVIAIADIDKDGLNDYIVSRSYSTGTDSSYSVGYLSPTKNRKASRWIQFDQGNMAMPQIP